MCLHHHPSFKTSILPNRPKPVHSGKVVAYFIRIPGMAHADCTDGPHLVHSGFSLLESLFMPGLDSGGGQNPVDRMILSMGGAPV
jgi:hypothetical protein